MEPEGSLPIPQASANCSYPEPEKKFQTIFPYPT